MKSRWVYIARDVGAPALVKVGCSTDVAKRIKSLSIKGVRMELLADLPGDFELEARFHAHLFEDHSHSEWFRHSPKVDALVAAIRDGTFSPDSLPQKIRLPRKPLIMTEERRAAMKLATEVRRHGRWTGWTFNECGLTPRLVAGDEGLRTRILEYLADHERHSHRWLYSDTWHRWYLETPSYPRRADAKAAA